MNDPILSSALLPRTASPVPIPRSVERFCLGFLAASAGVSAAAFLIFGVATQSNVDAERMFGAKADGSGYLTALIGAVAAVHGRPNSF